MAMGLLYRCTGCGLSVTTWDEGNPYILDDQGEMHFFYHPGGWDVVEEVVNSSAVGMTLTGKEREAFIHSRVGNQSDHICLDCGTLYRCDIERAEPVCPGCASGRSCRTWRIEGVECPKCRKGVFERDVEFTAIS
jgi:DNA-directed RNA polymerase subunit RPC12/RpoP